MAGVVIIHAPEDAAPANALAAKLRARGVRTASDLKPGPQIRQALADADAIVALWSPRSTARPDLIGEAAFGRSIGRLIHARMQNSAPPPQFGSDPTIDLTGWRGENDFSGWMNLQAAIEGVMEAHVPPPEPDFGEPEPAPLAPPPLTEPPPDYHARPYREPEPPFAGSAYSPPPPRDYDYEEQRSYASEPPEPSSASPMRLAVIGLITFLVVAGVGIGGYIIYQNGQSGGGESAWAALDKTDPAALRAFLDAGRAGKYSGPAEAALEELELARLREARATDTRAALEAFLADFPRTRHSVEVRGRIAELRQIENAEAQMIAETPDPTLDDAGLDATFGEPNLPEPPAAFAPGPGGPVALQPDSDPQATEEELRRALTGEDEPASAVDLRRPTQRPE